MKKIGNFELDNVYCGDCEKLMKHIPSNKVDLIVTDPPYGLEFMNKDWDRLGNYGEAHSKKPKPAESGQEFKDRIGRVSYNATQNVKCRKCGHWKFSGTPCKCKKPDFPDIKQFQAIAIKNFHRDWGIEALRVLKNGAFAFIMCSPRQDLLSAMIQGLSEAGFNTGFTSIYWTYASGFPKASNMGKMADKRRIGGQFKPIREYLRESWKKSGKTQKYLKKAIGDLTTGGGRISHYFGTVIAQPSVPNWEDWCILKKELNMDDRFDYFLKEYEREVTGKDKNWGKKGSTPLTGYKEFERKDKPITPQAKSLNGSYAGFQPKPAVEVIIVAMKPLSEKTYVDQALKNRKGITWLDDGRIPYESEGTVASNPKLRVEKGCKTKTGDRIFCQGELGKKNTMISNVKTGGRFPANLLVSDDVLNDGKTLRSGGRTGLKHSPEIFGNAKSNIGKTIELNPYQDSGSFSRYFDLDKWWKKKVKELDKYFSKAYNKEENKKGDMQWEVKQAEESRGLAKSGLSVNGAENNSKITQATKRDKNTIFVQKVAMPILDLQDLNQDVEFVEKKSNCTETDFVQKFVQIKQDTETLIEILNIEIKDNEISTQQKRHLKSNPTDVKNAIQKLQLLRDTIQICQDQLKLYGYVNPAIIEPMLLDLNQDLLLKNLNFEILPSNVKRTFPFIVCAKASKSEKNRGLENLKDSKVNDFMESGAKWRVDKRSPNGGYEVKGRSTKNIHPTVKPIKLMSYLITLGSREGDIILDNFCGSGSTLVSAKMLNRRFLGFDTEMEYVIISRARLSAVKQIQEKLL